MGTHLAYGQFCNPKHFIFFDAKSSYEIHETVLKDSSLSINIPREHYTFSVGGTPHSIHTTVYSHQEEMEELTNVIMAMPTSSPAKGDPRAKNMRKSECIRRHDVNETPINVRSSARLQRQCLLRGEHNTDEGRQSPAHPRSGPSY